MRSPSYALWRASILMGLGILFTTFGVLGLSNAFNSLWDCVHTYVLSTCGPDPHNTLDFLIYPLTALGLVLTVIGFALAMRGYLQAVNREKEKGV